MANSKQLMENRSMLNRSHRFHGYNSLRSVYARGQTVRGTLLSLKYLSRDAARPYRVAVVVSRKVHKSAVVRNRIRRRLYEGVRNNDKLLSPGLDLVFTAFGEDLAVMDATRFENTLVGLIRKAARGPVGPGHSAKQASPGIVKSEGKTR